MPEEEEKSLKEWRQHLESLPAILSNHPFMERVKDLPPSLREAFKDFLDDIAYVMQEQEEEYMSGNIERSNNNSFMTEFSLSGNNDEMLNIPMEDELNINDIPLLPGDELVLPEGIEM